MLQINRTSHRLLASALVALPTTLMLALSLQTFVVASTVGMATKKLNASAVAESSAIEVVSLPVGSETASIEPGTGSSDRVIFQQIVQRLQQNGNDADAHGLLGHQYNLAGLHELAREQFAIAFRLDPSRDEKVFESFKKKFTSEEPASAFTDWVEVRQSHAKDGDVQLMNEMVTRLYGSVDYAETVYLREIANDRPLHEINVELSFYESISGNYERALALANHDVAGHASDAGWLACARALNGLHRYRASQSIAKILFGSNPLMRGAARELAIAQLGLGQAENAVAPAALNLLVWQLPEDIQAAQQLSVEAVRQTPDHRLREALVPAIRIATRAGAMPEYHKRLADVYIATGMTARAKDELAAAIKEGTTDAEVYCMQASLLGSNPNEVQMAITLLQGSAKLDPFNTVYRDRSRRLSERLSNKSNDWAWLLKSALRS
jgi:tetratricopeptide (TPR) repeat protein